VKKATPKSSSPLPADKGRPEWIPGNYGNHDIVSNKIVSASKSQRSVEKDKKASSAVNSPNNKQAPGLEEADLAFTGEEEDVLLEPDDDSSLSSIDKDEDDIPAPIDYHESEDKFVSKDQMKEFDGPIEEDVIHDLSQDTDFDLEHEDELNSPDMIPDAKTAHTNTPQLSPSSRDSTLYEGKSSSKRSSPVPYPRETEASRLRTIQIADRYDIGAQAEPKPKPRAGTTYYQPHRKAVAASNRLDQDDLDSDTQRTSEEGHSNPIHTRTVDAQEEEDEGFEKSDNKSTGMSGPYEYKAKAKPAASAGATPSYAMARNSPTGRRTSPSKPSFATPRTPVTAARAPSIQAKTVGRSSNRPDSSVAAAQRNAYLSKSAPSKLSSAEPVKPAIRPFTIRRLEYHDREEEVERERTSAKAATPTASAPNYSPNSYISESMTRSTTRTPRSNASPTRYPALTEKNLSKRIYPSKPDFNQNSSQNESFFQMVEKRQGRRVSPGGFGLRSSNPSAERGVKLQAEVIDDIVRQELVNFEARVAKRLTSSSPILEDRDSSRHRLSSAAGSRRSHPISMRSYHTQQSLLVVDEYQTTETAEWHRLTNWLQSIHMGKYARVFKSHGITKLSVVELLQQEDLEEIIADSEDIEHILSHIHEFSHQTRQLSEQALNDGPRTSSAVSVTRNISERLQASIQKALSSSKVIKSTSNVPPAVDSEDDVSIHFDRIYQRTSTRDPTPTEAEIARRPPAHRLPAESLFQLIMDCFDAGNLNSFLTHWRSSKLESGLIIIPGISHHHEHPINLASPSMQATITIEFFLLIYFLVYSIKHHNGKQQQINQLMRGFIDSLSQEASQSASPIQLLQSNDFGVYSGIVFIPSPQENVSYAHLFKEDWSQIMRTRLEKFLGVMLNVSTATSTASVPYHRTASPVQQAIMQLNLQSASRSNSFSISSKTPRNSILINKPESVGQPLVQETAVQAQATVAKAVARERSVLPPTKRRGRGSNGSAGTGSETLSPTSQAAYSFADTPTSTTSTLTDRDFRTFENPMRRRSMALAPAAPIYAAVDRRASLPVENFHAMTMEEIEAEKPLVRKENIIQALREKQGKDQLKTGLSITIPKSASSSTMRRATSTPVQTKTKARIPSNNLKDQIAGYKKLLKTGIKTVGLGSSVNIY
jgi:hypothetical protein